MIQSQRDRLPHGELPLFPSLESDHVRVRESGGFCEVGRHARGVPMISDLCAKLVRHPNPSLRKGQQNHAAIGADAATVEGGGDFLALHRWQRERRQAIVDHGGYGSPAMNKGGSYVRCVSPASSTPGGPTKPSRPGQDQMRLGRQPSNGSTPRWATSRPPSQALPLRSTTSMSRATSPNSNAVSTADTISPP
jgi:hypothetical protein